MLLEIFPGICKFGHTLLCTVQYSSIIPFAEMCYKWDILSLSVFLFGDTSGGNGWDTFNVEFIDCGFIHNNECHEFAITLITIIIVIGIIYYYYNEISNV
jgi:hypothetical protein